MSVYPTPSARDAEWMESAVCAQTDPALWYPEKGHLSTKAKKICAGCPVRNDCLDYGMTDPYGIYAGTTPRQRNRMSRARHGRLCTDCGHTFLNVAHHRAIAHHDPATTARPARAV